MPTVEGLRFSYALHQLPPGRIGGQLSRRVEQPAAAEPVPVGQLGVVDVGVDDRGDPTPTP